MLLSIAVVRAKRELIAEEIARLERVGDQAALWDTQPMDDETQEQMFRRLGDTSESMIRVWRQFEDIEAAMRFWDGLPPDEQRLVAFSLVRLIAEYRNDLGHPIDAHYGFPAPPPNAG